ncbi:MAG: vWA domain-containing protein [Shimia sp.]|uniref:vWA domain-containing protein n=1 Tax=Shimia sp. TaxID=1954381 RepID=UPI00405A2EF5
MTHVSRTGFLAAATLAWSVSSPVANVGACSVDAMLVFDGSTSMAEISFETGPITRIVEARQAVRRAMPDIAPYRRIGLLVYGPGPKGACGNLDLRFGPIEGAAEPVIEAIDGLQPDGLTPLTDAVRRAAEVMEYRERPGVVVLVTDGNETCGGRPCELARQFRATARDLVVHVIGFRAEVDFFAWNNPEQDPLDGTTVASCLADQTGGLFVTTETVDELVAALQRTLGCPVIG